MKRLILCVLCAFGLSTFAADQPNILLILADDLGYGDVGCYNAQSKVSTPHLDRLAREGIRFTDAHSPSTVCTPTRYSLLTGRMAFRLNYRGVFTGVGGPCLINQGRLTLASLLKQQGYATAMYGKWHLGHRVASLPMQHGFDDYFGLPYSNDMWPYHPEQGTIFNFDDLKLYENENILKTIEDQSFLTEAITDRAIIL